MRGEKKAPAKNEAPAQKKATAKAAKKKRHSKKWKPPAKKVDFSKSNSVTDEKLKDMDETISKAAATYKIPEAFIRAVVTVESSYKVKALSYKGAMGLMQLMPGTAADMGVTDPYDPYQNIMGGTRFLRILANRFNGDMPKVLAAYHAGGRAVATSNGIPYRGSAGYVRKVLDNYYRLKKGQ